jgi:hypothetical protein
LTSSNSLELVERRDVGFRSLQENIDTTTPGGKLIFHTSARWPRLSATSFANARALDSLPLRARGVGSLASTAQGLPDHAC